MWIGPDGKEYRNLEEQVLKNKEDIKELQESGGSGTVKSVNGILPDEEFGDVEIHANEIYLTTTETTVQGNIIRLDERIDDIPDTIAGAGLYSDSGKIRVITGDGVNYDEFDRLTVGLGDGLEFQNEGDDIGIRMDYSVNAPGGLKINGVTGELEVNPSVYQKRLIPSDGIIFRNSEYVEVDYDDEAGLEIDENTSQLKVKVDGTTVKFSGGALAVNTTNIQPKLTAGTGITISGNTISASGGGGAKYIHNVYIKNADSCTLTCQLITDSSTEYYFGTNLAAALYIKGYRGANENEILTASGVWCNGEQETPEPEIVIGIAATNSTTLHVYTLDYDNGIYRNNHVFNSNSIKDKVIQL